MIRGKLTEEHKKILIGIVNSILNYKRSNLKCVDVIVKEKSSNDYIRKLEEIKSILEEVE